MLESDVNIIWADNFPLPTTARTLKLGFMVGLGYGLLQDAITLLKGRPVGYVELIKSVPGRWQKPDGSDAA